MKVAWVFPGQGSQKIGMAKQIENLPNTKERFSFASEIFDRNLFEICELNSDSTKKRQICVFLVLFKSVRGFVGSEFNSQISNKFLSNISEA